MIYWMLTGYMSIIVTQAGAEIVPIFQKYPTQSSCQTAIKIFK